jgi:hypothetical protein
MLGSRYKCKKISATYFGSFIPENITIFSKLLKDIGTRTNAVQSCFKWTHQKKKYKHFPTMLILNVEFF